MDTQTKKCTRCGEVKPFDLFYMPASKKGRPSTYCKVCTTEKMREWNKKPRAAEYQKQYRQTEKGKAIHAANYRRQQAKYRNRYPERKKARSRVQHEINAGRLPRPGTMICTQCAAPATEYHHHLGYEPEHWLSVQPICRSCHVKLTSRPVAVAT